MRHPKPLTYIQQNTLVVKLSIVARLTLKVGILNFIFFLLSSLFLNMLHLTCMPFKNMGVVVPNLCTIFVSFLVFLDNLFVLLLISFVVILHILRLKEG